MANATFELVQSARERVKTSLPLAREKKKQNPQALDRPLLLGLSRARGFCFFFSLARVKLVLTLSRSLRTNPKDAFAIRLGP